MRHLSVLCKSSKLPVAFFDLKYLSKSRLSGTGHAKLLQAPRRLAHNMNYGLEAIAVQEDVISYLRCRQYDQQGFPSFYHNITRVESCTQCKGNPWSTPEKDIYVRFMPGMYNPSYRACDDVTYQQKRQLISQQYGLSNSSLPSQSPAASSANSTSGYSTTPGPSGGRFSRLQS